MIIHTSKNRPKHDTLETTYVNKIEWACFKFLAGDDDPKLQYISPHEPFREITFKDADEFTSFIVAGQTSKTNNYDGVISREAVEHLTYLTLKNLIDHHPVSVNGSRQIYDDFRDLECIIDSVPDHYERAEVTMLNDKKQKMISEYLVENFGGAVTDKIYEL